MDAGHRVGDEEPMSCIFSQKYKPIKCASCRGGPMVSQNECWARVALFVLALSHIRIRITPVNIKDKEWNAVPARYVAHAILVGDDE